jgi:hypothetical protein
MLCCADFRSDPRRAGGSPGNSLKSSLQDIDNTDIFIGHFLAQEILDTGGPAEIFSFP